jgi:hypothetical protein
MQSLFAKRLGMLANIFFPNAFVLEEKDLTNNALFIMHQDALDRVRAFTGGIMMMMACPGGAPRHCCQSG